MASIILQQALTDGIYSFSQLDAAGSTLSLEDQCPSLEAAPRARNRADIALRTAQRSALAGDRNGLATAFANIAHAAAQTIRLTDQYRAVRDAAPSSVAAKDTEDVLSLLIKPNSDMDDELGWANRADLDAIGELKSAILQYDPEQDEGMFLCNMYDRTVISAYELLRKIGKATARLATANTAAPHESPTPAEGNTILSTNMQGVVGPLVDIVKTGPRHIEQRQRNRASGALQHLHASLYSHKGDEAAGSCGVASLANAVNSTDTHLVDTEGSTQDKLYHWQDVLYGWNRWQHDGGEDAGDAATELQEVSEAVETTLEWLTRIKTKRSEVRGDAAHNDRVQAYKARRDRTSWRH